MNRCAGFYTLVQYWPDPERAEGVNIGVLLFETGRGLVEQKFLPDLVAVHERFPWAMFDEVRFERAWRAVVERIRREPVRTREDLRSFAAKEAGNLVMTEPRSIAFEDATAITAVLHAKLVQPPQAHLPKGYRSIPDEWSNAAGEGYIIVRPVPRSRAISAQSKRAGEASRTDDFSWLPTVSPNPSRGPQFVASPALTGPLVSRSTT